MKINFVRKDPRAVIPFKAHIDDAGFDLTAISSIYDPTTKTLTCDTGLAIDIPKGYVGKIFPRSSVAKKGLSLCNSVGIIDSGYTNSIGFKFYAITERPDLYAPGDKVGQIIIEKLENIEFNEVTELPEYERGLQGWGSSGR